VRSPPGRSPRLVPVPEPGWSGPLPDHVMRGSLLPNNRRALGVGRPFSRVFAFARWDLAASSRCGMVPRQAIARASCFPSAGQVQALVGQGVAMTTAGPESLLLERYPFFRNPLYEGA
jgi:hypothetical protein